MARNRSKIRSSQLNPWCACVYVYVFWPSQFVGSCQCVGLWYMKFNVSKFFPQTASKSHKLLLRIKMPVEMGTKVQSL